MGQSAEKKNLPLPLKKNNLTLHSAALNTELRDKFQAAKEKKVAVEEFFEEFLLSCLSPETQRAYAQDLKSFFDFLRSGGETLTHPQDFKSFHFQLYRDHLRELGRSSATINRKLVAIRSFMKWALAAKLIEHNPLELLKLPKVQTESPTLAFTDEEVARMIAAPALDTLKGRTHRLVIVLLFYLGLRRSELVGLKLSDIFEDRGHVVLRIFGKGGKIRLLPLHPFVQTEIEAYLNELKYQSLEIEADDPLLQAEPQLRSRQPLDGSTIYRWVQKYAQACDIHKRVSPHSCRATAISHLLETQSTPIRDVAIFAGHSQVTTTERYDKRRDHLDKSAAYCVGFVQRKKTNEIS
jgi:integrase/recombinase XerD